MKTKYIVETLVTFMEYHVVEAENESQAIDISNQSDYNSSIHLGNQVVSVYPETVHDNQRLSRKDKYFFKGYASVDGDDYLVYRKNDGSINQNMPKHKIILKKP